MTTPRAEIARACLHCEFHVPHAKYLSSWIHETEPSTSTNSRGSHSTIVVGWSHVKTHFTDSIKSYLRMDILIDKHFPLYIRPPRFRVRKMPRRHTGAWVEIIDIEHNSLYLPSHSRCRGSAAGHYGLVAVTEQLEGLTVHPGSSSLVGMGNGAL